MFNPDRRWLSTKKTMFNQSTDSARCIQRLEFTISHRKLGHLRLFLDKQSREQTGQYQHSAPNKRVKAVNNNLRAITKSMILPLLATASNILSACKTR